MQFTVTYDRPDPEEPGSGPVQVGWLLTDAKAGIVFEPPRRLRSTEVNKAHAKSASRCPAVIGLESRYFEIPCPFDLHLKFGRDKDGKPAVKNMLGDASPVRAEKLRKHVHITAEKEWRYPDRPTLQLSLPYLFIADDPVWMNQIAPFLHYRPDPLPGTIFGGRFPINLWPRPLMWAFEWHDPRVDIRLKRGEPLFYVQFETVPQDRAVQLIEAERTPELDEYLDLVSGAVNYVNQTFSLFRSAEERRPSRLLTRKERR